MASFLRWIVGFIGIGALAGIGVVSLIAPKILEWNNTLAYGAPTGQCAGLCVCADTARQAAEALLHAQYIGALVGGGGGLILGIASAAMLRARKKRQEAGQTAPDSAGPSAKP